MKLRSLRAWLWVVAAVGLVVWTLAAWVGAAVVGQASEIVAWGQSPLAGMPQLFEWLKYAAALVERIGAPLVWGLWLAGVLLAGAFTAALAWLLRRNDVIRDL